MRLALNDVGLDVRPRNVLAGVELAGLHACREHVREGVVNDALAQDPGLDVLLNVLGRVLATGAVEVCTGSDGKRLTAGGSRYLLAGAAVGPHGAGAAAVGGPSGRSPVVPRRRILIGRADRAAIGGRVAVLPVRALCEVVGGVGGRRPRRPVHRVVGGHEPRDVGVLEQTAELRGVVVANVGVVCHRIIRLPVVLDVVQRVVLGGRGNLEVLGERFAGQRFALIAVHEGAGHAAYEVGVLAEGLVRT